MSSNLSFLPSFISLFYKLLLITLLLISDYSKEKHLPSTLSLEILGLRLCKAGGAERNCFWLWCSWGFLWLPALWAAPGRGSALRWQHLKPVYSGSSLILVQSLSHVQLFATAWTAAGQASLSFTVSQSLLKFMSIETVMPSNHLILCCPLLLLPSIFPSIRVFSNELVLQLIRHHLKDRAWAVPLLWPESQAHGVFLWAQRCQPQSSGVPFSEFHVHGAPFLSFQLLIINHFNLVPWLIEP